MNSVVSTIAATIEILDRHGWKQSGQNNAMGFRDGPWGGYRLHDAIMETIRGKEWQAQTIRALSLAVDPAGRGTSIELCAWNEARGRTKEQVYALLRSCAAAHR